MACQIMDAIYPGKVALGKVNFDAKSHSNPNLASRFSRRFRALHSSLPASLPRPLPFSAQPESVSNFKVLQSVFDKEQISKYVDVSKLLNGKFQDNLEFLQYRAHRTISMHEAVCQRLCAGAHCSSGSVCCVYMLCLSAGLWYPRSCLSPASLPLPLTGSTLLSLAPAAVSGSNRTLTRTTYDPHTPHTARSSVALCSASTPLLHTPHW